MGIIERHEYFRTQQLQLGTPPTNILRNPPFFDAIFLSIHTNSNPNPGLQIFDAHCRN